MWTCRWQHFVKYVFTAVQRVHTKTFSFWRQTYEEDILCTIFSPNISLSNSFEDKKRRNKYLCNVFTSKYSLSIFWGQNNKSEKFCIKFSHQNVICPNVWGRKLEQIFIYYFVPLKNLFGTFRHQNVQKLLSWYV